MCTLHCQLVHVYITLPVSVCTVLSGWQERRAAKEKMDRCTLIKVCKAFWFIPFFLRMIVFYTYIFLLWFLHSRFFVMPAHFIVTTVIPSSAQMWCQLVNDLHTAPTDRQTDI